MIAICKLLMSFRFGVDVLFDEREPYLQQLHGKRIGLITNPTGVDSALISIVERFRHCTSLTLAALYGPEHGVRGNAQAGEFVEKYHDSHFGGLPVYSLYGQGLAKLQAGSQMNFDETMREFDTQHTEKRVESDMLQGIDVLVFDIQDVGTRVYTYVATMAYAMQAAAAANIPFYVLDRPNPIGGALMEGPVLEYPRLSSFIGLYPVPCRHGMTVAELAQLFNAEFITPSANLVVVPCQGLTRDMWYDELQCPNGRSPAFVSPSPNMPTLDTAIVYPGMVMFEGTNLSEGRGTTKPFELWGAPFIDGYLLSADLNAFNLSGVRFREVYFTPTFSKFVGERCGGCQTHVVDRRSFRPVVTAIAILLAVRARYASHLTFFDDYFDRVLGNSTVREAILRGDLWTSIAQSWDADLQCDSGFAAKRLPFLLYE